MRNPAAIATHGTGRSRSKPLAAMHHNNSGKNPSNKMLIRQKGYYKMMSLYEAVIKKTATSIKINMLKPRFAVKKGIQTMVEKAKIPFKLNINK